MILVTGATGCRMWSRLANIQDVARLLNCLGSLGVRDEKHLDGDITVEIAGLPGGRGRRGIGLMDP